MLKWNSPKWLWQEFVIQRVDNKIAILCVSIATAVDGH